jgi:hypothetical protein
MSSLLEKYFKYKNDYLQKYGPYKDFELFKVRKTNMLINFYEIDRKYIAEIIDPDNRETIYYRKTISQPEDKQVIDLSHLYDNLKNVLNSMNVDYNKEDYLRQIREIEKERDDLTIIKNSLTQPDQNITLKLDNVVNRLEILQNTFKDWLNKVEEVFLKMEIIQSIQYEKVQNENNDINEYTISYYWLNNKISNKNNDEHFVMAKLHTQGTIKNNNDIVKYASKYYVIKLINNTQVTIQDITTNSNTIIVPINDLIHEMGTYLIFKDYNLVNGNIIRNTDDVYKLPTEQAPLILSKLTYQEEGWNIGDIVMYNNEWYLINSFDGTDKINIQDMEDTTLINVSKDVVIHPIGYRKKYKTLNYTSELILPINKWIESFGNINQYYINNRQLYQGSEIKNNTIVRYKDNWHIVLSVSLPNITIRNLENKMDNSPKTVLINDVSYREGYYNRYKRFNYTSNLVIPLNDWINRLNAYNIVYDKEDYVTELDEYPSGLIKDTYMRVETDEMKKERLQKLEIRKEKRIEKEAAMTEEEKEAQLAKKEAAKLKRAETMRLKKEEKVQLSEEEKIEEELKKEKKKLEKKEKSKIPKIPKEKVSEGPKLDDIKQIHSDFIKRRDIIGNDLVELKKLVKEFGEFAKNVAISTNADIAKYGKTTLIKQVNDWVNEYTQLRLNK